MIKNNIGKNKKTAFITHMHNQGIYELHLYRPEKMNALNFEMYQELADTIVLIDNEPEVKVLILTGSQGHFTSGNDLADFMQSLKSLKADMPVLHFMKALKNFSKPVIAAVEGHAIGIGTTLLLHCDFIYVSETTTFKLPFVSLGLCPEYGSSLLLPAMVGHVKASEWMLLGKFFSAQDALTAGMINCIVDDPLAVARKTAKEIEQLPPLAVQRTKALLKKGLQTNVDEIMQEEIELFSKSLMEDEFLTAATAFLEKNNPSAKLK